MATKQGHESLDEAIRAGLKDRRQPAEVSITLGERSERGHRHGDQRDATRARDRAEAPKLLEARWRSSMVSPGRRPWSRSACRTQRRNVSAAPDLLGDRPDRRPLRVVLLLILQHHPHRALPDFRREPAESRHAPILSRSGASEKAGAAQPVFPVVCAPKRGDRSPCRLLALRHPSRVPGESSEDAGRPSRVRLAAAAQMSDSHERVGRSSGEAQAAMLS